MSRAVIVGAGIVGLATAWHLQERGVEVTVLDRRGVAAGSSWGNAGWLTPGKAIPLADPSLWQHAPQALFDPRAALHVPLRADPAMWSFLLRFAAHGTRRAWDRTMAALTPIDLVALEAFDELADGGVEAPTVPGPFVIGFRTAKNARGFLREIDGVIRHGQSLEFHALDDPQSLAPQLSDRVGAAYRLEGQRFIEPGPYVESLAASVRARGGEIVDDAHVVRLGESGGSPELVMADGSRLAAGTVVLATGAWLPALARQAGVRMRVQAGRGYSFSVPTTEPARHPIYLPHERLACTPYEGRLRIAGTMEFRRPDEPFQSSRVAAMVRAARELLTGIDLEDRADEWVGSRPVTPDGLPLVGATARPGVFVAGGHGMWGVVLGPATGKLLAERIVTGRTPAAIAAFDPLR